MLRLQNIGLTQGAVTDLQAWQAIVDGMPTFPGQVTEAKRQFKLKNTRSNPAFQVVRSALTQMHGELIRCAYCEDSVADEVEHIYPKDLYPERVFVWENYTYACGPCNGPKSNRFAIFLATDGSEVDISPPKRKPQGWIAARPPKGDALLIDPRNENPLDFLWLDLDATCRIDPRIGLLGRQLRRAEYIRDLLDLNCDFLLRARRNARIFAWDVLKRYSELKARNAPPAELAKRREAIETMAHKTVWKEMIRQRTFFPVLNAHFNANPEALAW